MFSIRYLAGCLFVSSCSEVASSRRPSLRSGQCDILGITPPDMKVPSRLPRVTGSSRCDG